MDRLDYNTFILLSKAVNPRPGMKVEGGARKRDPSPGQASLSARSKTFVPTRAGHDKMDARTHFSGLSEMARGKSGSSSSSSAESSPTQTTGAWTGGVNYPSSFHLGYKAKARTGPSSQMGMQPQPQRLQFNAEAPKFVPRPSQQSGRGGLPKSPFSFSRQYSRSAGGYYPS